MLSLIRTPRIRNDIRIRVPSLPIKRKTKRIIACWGPHRRRTAPDVQGTSSTPISGSARPLVLVKLSTMMTGVASRSGIVMPIRIDVVEGEVERARSVGTAVVGEAAGSVDAVPTALPPSVPPQLQLARLCL